MDATPKLNNGVPKGEGENMRFLRGMWIWNTLDLLSSPSQTDQLVIAAHQINITDVYLYVAPKMYSQYAQGLADLNSKVQASGVRVWALDGDRAYFESDDGQEVFMDGLRNLISFNDQQTDLCARFHGFQADIEPQDTSGDHKLPFNNGIPESQLSSEQRITRDIVLHKWVNVHTRAANFLHSYDMAFGAAMPFWLHDYEGEPITLPWPNGPKLRRCVMDLIMPLVDEYVAMSYNTDPANAAGRAAEQARYASSLIQTGGHIPRVLGSLETAKGVGANISYGDTPGKESKLAVLVDLEKIEGILEKYPAFSGMAIHHWAAWEKLS